MEKYKICPYCGRRNPPKMLECIQCETDLSNIRVVDEETEAKKNESDQGANEKKAEMVRICDCGARNPVNARKCAECGEDISDVMPVPEPQEAQKVFPFTLVSIDGAYTFEITEPSVLVGREAAMREYLETKPYVSRQHARLSVEGEHLYIYNLSGTNYTYVNNRKIPEEKTELHDGDEVGLGGNQHNGLRQEAAAYFQVRMGLCT